MKRYFQQIVTPDDGSTIKFQLPMLHNNPQFDPMDMTGFFLTVLLGGVSWLMNGINVAEWDSIVILLYHLVQLVIAALSATIGFLTVRKMLRTDDKRRSKE